MQKEEKCCQMVRAARGTNWERVKIVLNNADDSDGFPIGALPGGRVEPQHRPLLALLEQGQLKAGRLLPAVLEERLQEHVRDDGFGVPLADEVLDQGPWVTADAERAFSELLST